MRLVRAKKGDVMRVSDCRRDAILHINSKTYTEGAIKEFIEDNSPENVAEDIKLISVYCLKRFGKLIGTVSFYGNKIDGLYVDPKYVGRGYGVKMLRFAERKIRKKYDSVILYSTVNSEFFYSAKGYKSEKLFVSFSKEPLLFVEMVKKLR